MAHRAGNAAQFQPETAYGFWYGHEAGRNITPKSYGQGEETLYLCGTRLRAGSVSGAGLYAKGHGYRFSESDRLRVPVILETDAQSKCDKYVHLGMELAGVRDMGEYGKMYDLIRYPAAEKQ